MMSVQEYAEEMNFNVQAVINKCRELGKNGWVISPFCVQ